MSQHQSLSVDKSLPLWFVMYRVSGDQLVYFHVRKETKEEAEIYGKEQLYAVLDVKDRFYLRLHSIYEVTA